MFDRLSLFQDLQRPGDQGPRILCARQYDTALSHFKTALLRGKLSRLKRKIMRSPQWLYDLHLLKEDLSLRGGSYAGIQVVQISSIIGSEGRTSDFDVDFHPISEISRERWVSMAIAHLSRLALPPIQLIQVGDAYFVRDGHHRISVGRAFGQVAMDAEVITWKAVPPFPWQPSFAKRNLFVLEHPDLST